MLQSMTGFGRGEATDDDFTVVVEIKSVNNRFKDIRFKMPSSFTPLELTLRKTLADKFSRGSFDVFVSYKRAEGKSKFDELDYDKIDDYLQRISARAKKLGLTTQVSATEFLRSEFYKDQDEMLTTTMPQRLEEAYEKALNELHNSRSIEGQKLIESLKDYLATYRNLFEAIESKASEFKPHVEERLKKKISDHASDVGVEESRLLQEVIFYLEKMDINEEIDRIKAHLSKFDSILTSDKEVGREIDFLVQELNRETNTIGSKSSIKEISELVVQMKVQLEKIREQGLNLE
jgi:uncharacterized protein (TIGR00255 family)